jgi:hypothetical protein
MDDDNKSALNISVSTAGFNTLKVWLKRGFDFCLPLNKNRKDNMFVACQFGHIDVI